MEERGNEEQFAYDLMNRIILRKMLEDGTINEEILEAYFDEAKKELINKGLRIE